LLVERSHKWASRRRWPDATLYGVPSARQCGSAIHRLRFQHKEQRWRVPRGKGVPPATAGPRRPSRPGPATLAGQRERCAVRQGTRVARYGSLSAGSVSNLSVSARLLDRIFAICEENKKICVVKPADSPRRSAYSAQNVPRIRPPFPHERQAASGQVRGSAIDDGTHESTKWTNPSAGKTLVTDTHRAAPPDAPRQATSC
jgi:hypothetical protein